MLQTHLNTPHNSDNFEIETTHIVGTCLSTSLTDSLRQIIDSGVSSYIFHDKFMFKNLHSTQNMSVSMSTKTRLKGEHVGDIFITNELILKDVLYISDFKYNLLSVSTLLKNERFVVSFYDSNCPIQDKLLLKMIENVELTNGLYLLIMKNERVNCIQHTELMCKASTST